MRNREQCRECGGKLTILGTSPRDLVEVECRECGSVYEVEQDGLGMAGHEYVIARMKDGDKNVSL